MPDSIRRVFVTGASGKLGVPLCAALLKAGYEVVALRHRYPVGVPVSTKSWAMCPTQP